MRDYTRERAEFTGIARGGEATDPRYDEARNKLATEADDASAASTKAAGRASDIEAQGSTSFMKELGSTRSIITGLGALAALASGEGEAALGLAAGGLLGTSQRSDQINKTRKEDIVGQEAAARDERGQAIQARGAILQSAQGLEQQQYKTSMDLVTDFIGQDYALELQRLMQLHQRTAQMSDQDHDEAMAYIRGDIEATLIEQKYQNELGQMLTKYGADYGISSWEELKALGGAADMDAEDSAWVQTVVREADSILRIAEEDNMQRNRLQTQEKGHNFTLDQMALTAEFQALRDETLHDMNLEVLGKEFEQEWATLQSAQDHANFRDRKHQDYTIELIDKEYGNDMEKLKLDFGVDSLEELRRLGGAHELDARRQAKYQEYLIEAGHVYRLFESGKGNMISRRQATTFMQMSTEDLQGHISSQDQYEALKGIRTAALGWAIESRDLNGMNDVFALQGFEAGHPVYTLSRNIVEAATAQDREAAINELEAAYLPYMTTTSRQNYYNERTRLESLNYSPADAKRKAMKGLRLEQTAMDLSLDETKVLRESMGGVFAAWAGATEVEREDSMQFIADNTSEEGMQYLLQSGRLTELNQMLFANDQNNMAANLNQALNSILANEDSAAKYNAMTPAQQTKYLGQTAYEIGRDRKNVRQVTEYNTRVRSASQQFGMEMAEQYGEATGMASQQALEQGALQLSNLAYLSGEELDVVMAEFAEDLRSAAEEDGDPASFAEKWNRGYGNYTDRPDAPYVPIFDEIFGLVYAISHRGSKFKAEVDKLKKGDK